MKWKAQVRINKHTGKVVCDELFPDGLCNGTGYSDSRWSRVCDESDAWIDDCIWVKVEYDDGEPT